MVKFNARIIIILAASLCLQLNAFAGLVGHWELDGNVSDTAGSGNGTVWGSGGVDPATAGFTTGWINQALELTGSGQYVDVPRVVADDFTIALWVKTSDPGFIPEKTAWDYGKGLIGRKVVGGSNDFGLSVLNSRFCFGVGDTSISSTSKISNGSWNHLAATRDKNTGLIKIFVNGVQENTATGITVSLTDPGSLVIGNVIAGWPGYTYHWASYNGLIDDVRMYDHVLSETELQALAAGSTPIPSEPICSVYPLGDLNEDCIVDMEDFVLMAWGWLGDNLTIANSQWTVQEAWNWYDQMDPIAGCNYIPRNAINPTEMWQSQTFDPVTISEELGWAQSAGINSARVFIPYVVYEEDAEGLIDRMEQFLTIADNNNISVTFVLLDATGGEEPFAGPQPDPVPGVHNSGWTQSPGEVREQRHHWSKLQKYVIDVVTHFANDQRVLMWDLYNEAQAASRPLVEKTFEWARSANPSQPLTSCWEAADLWDIASYHHYTSVGDLSGYGDGRPFIFTETISRTSGCTFQDALPVFARYNAGWYMRGLVKGETQTIWPFGSNPGDTEPSIWLCNLLHPDGSVYDQAEVDLIHDFPDMFNVYKALKDPLIDESEDVPGAVTGFPDPYPFRWGDDYYLFHSVVSFSSGRTYRTRTFEKDDLTKFWLTFDYGSMPGVLQVWGFHPYQHTDGSYHAYGSVHYGGYETEVVHFVPQPGQVWTENTPITHWKQQSILVGQQQIGAKTAYDGTVFLDDDGTLYLVDNEQISGTNYIVVRRMLDPDTIDQTFPRRILLGPDNYRSEDLPWSLRLTEGTFLEKINGKYVIIYSVGYYSDGSYKVGAAFSDTMLPPGGQQYQKVLIDDPYDVWGNGGATGGKEVKYLLQTGQQNWPNYVGEFVNGPGIGSLTTLDSGENLLIFAARRSGLVNDDGSARYMWRVPVKYDFQNADMSKWITIRWGNENE